MTFKNPMWSPDKEAIIIGISSETKPYFPFVASSKDCEPTGRTIYQRAVDGELGKIEEYYDRAQYVVFRKDGLLHFKRLDYFSNIRICLEKDIPYWTITPEAYNAIKSYPIETWEIEGDPDGYGVGVADEEEINAVNENNREPGQAAGTENSRSEDRERPDTPGNGRSVEQSLVGDDARRGENPMADLSTGAA